MTSEHDIRLPDGSRRAPIRAKPRSSRHWRGSTENSARAPKAREPAPASHAADGTHAVAQENRHACPPTHCRQPRRPGRRLDHLAVRPRSPRPVRVATDCGAAEPPQTPVVEQRGVSGSCRAIRRRTPRQLPWSRRRHCRNKQVTVAFRSQRRRAGRLAERARDRSQSATPAEPQLRQQAAEALVPSARPVAPRDAQSVGRARHSSPRWRIRDAGWAAWRRACRSCARKHPPPTLEATAAPLAAVGCSTPRRRRGHLGDLQRQAAGRFEPQRALPPAEYGRPRPVRGRRREPVQDRARGAGLHVLDRRRHRLLFVRARLAQPQRPAAAGGGAHRGARQLLPLRLRGAGAAPTEPFRVDVVGVPEPVVGGPQDRPHRHQGLSASVRGAPARQPGAADRHVRLDECAEPAAAGQAVAGHAADAARADRPRRDRHLRRQRRHRARADAGVRESRRSRPRSSASQRRRQHRRRRRHPPGLRARRAELRSERRQPRDPGDRRRLQRRHHQPRRAQGLHRASAPEGHLPLGARLRHGQLQRRADAGAGAERQRRRRLHRHASTRRARCWSRKRPRRCSRSPRT